MSALGHKGTCAAHKLMSALGQKRTYAVQNGMSALPRQADKQLLAYGPKRTPAEPTASPRNFGVCSHAFSVAGSIGSLRTRLPVAANMALQRAGIDAGNGGSPNPVGGFFVIKK